MDNKNTEPSLGGLGIGFAITLGRVFSLLAYILHQPLILAVFFGLFAGSLLLKLLFEKLDLDLLREAQYLPTDLPVKRRRRWARAYRRAFWLILFSLLGVETWLVHISTEDLLKKGEIRTSLAVERLRRTLEIPPTGVQRYSRLIASADGVKPETSGDSLAKAILGIASYQVPGLDKKVALPLGFSLQEVKSIIEEQAFLHSRQISKDHYFLASLADDLNWLDGRSTFRRARALFYVFIVPAILFVAFALAFSLSLPIYVLCLFRIRRWVRRVH